MSAQVIAFYLPQYHPTPENNEWYGEGFTEWTNVGKAKPLFHAHYQPKVPADLGYYDLRLPQVRAKQAELAREAGISAFCYYYYWFGNGKQLLELPLQEVIKSGEPDFPFCICWANHTWYNKMWDATKNALNKKPLQKQEYPGLDDVEAHFYTLLDKFKDERYYKINGRLVFVVYRAEDVPYMKEMMERWQVLAEKEGLSPLYFISYIDDVARLQHPIHKLFESTIVFCKSNIDSVGKSRKVRKLSRFLQTLLAQFLHKALNVHTYASIRKKLLTPEFAQENIFPVLMPNWDNAPRQAEGALILTDCTPEQFEKHCEEVFEFVKHKNPENQVVFLKSWNEWGEGNYMEPCLKYRRGYIKALKKALNRFQTTNSL